MPIAPASGNAFDQRLIICLSARLSAGRWFGAHVSGKVIAERLRKSGHDVLALDEHRELEGRSDADVLALAAVEGRIVVTFNVRDFAPILRQWAGEGRSHAGCMLLVSIAQHAFGVILERVEVALAEVPEQEQWTDRAVLLGRR